MAMSLQYNFCHQLSRSQEESRDVCQNAASYLFNSSQPRLLSYIVLYNLPTPWIQSEFESNADATVSSHYNFHMVTSIGIVCYYLVLQANWRRKYKDISIPNIILYLVLFA